MTTYVLVVDSSSHSIESLEIDVFSINIGYILTYSDNIILYKIGEVFEGSIVDIGINDATSSVISSNIELFFIYRGLFNIDSFSSVLSIWEDFTYEEVDDLFEYPENTELDARFCLYSALYTVPITLIYKNCLVIDENILSHYCDGNLSTNYTFIIEFPISFMSSDHIDVFSVNCGNSNFIDTFILNAHYFSKFEVDTGSYNCDSSTNIRFFDFQKIDYIYPHISAISYYEIEFKIKTSLIVDNSTSSILSTPLELLSVNRGISYLIGDARVTCHMGTLEIAANIWSTTSRRFTINSYDLFCNLKTIGINSTEPEIHYNRSIITILSKPKYLFLSMKKEIIAENNSYAISDTAIEIKTCLDVYDSVYNYFSTLEYISYTLKINNGKSNTTSTSITSISYLRDGVWHIPITELESSISISSLNVESLVVTYIPKQHRGRCVCNSTNLILHSKHNINITNTNFIFKSSYISMYNQIPLYIPDYN